MKIKKDLEYSLKALVYLRGHKGVSPSKDIADEAGIPRDYLIQLFQPLRNADVVCAQPGKHGGYQLARDAKLITVLDVVLALEPEAVKDGCAGLAPEVSRVLDEALNGITIDSLAAKS